MADYSLSNKRVWVCGHKGMVGGALLERARRGGSAESEDAAGLVQEILRGLTRANDKKAFEGFEL